MSRVSLKDIALRAGVSNATVSLVLNGKSGDGRISDEVTQKVLRIAEEMDYRPNMAARSLRTGKTKTLGLIVADISNPFFAKLARHIENIAAQKGYQVMFGSSDESSEKFGKQINLFIEKNVDGLIVAPPQNSEESLIQLIKRKVPFVMVDRRMESVNASSVEIDNIEAARSITNLLIGKGCKKIGFLAYNLGLPNITKRYQGYVAALKENEIDLDQEMVCSVSYTSFEEDIEKSIKQLINRGVDSIVLATNRVAVHSLIELMKYDEHKRIKLGSIDNPDEFKLTDIPIICIEQPIEAIGQRALAILFKEIENPNYKEVESVLLHPEILELNP